ncbi:MAG: tetratricopeptide repeat protein [Dehalococcoidia bacterium]
MNGKQSVQASGLVMKFTAPRPARGVIPRPRIVDRLHAGIDRHLALIVAGPGSGKTTVLAQYASEVDFPVCYYRLDAWDHEPRLFLDHLTASVGQHFPGFGSLIQEQANDAAADNEAVSQAVEIFLRDFLATVSDYTVLILDDFHEVEASGYINLFLDALVQNLPENLYLIVSSRTRPRFRSLPRLLVNREAMMLRARDLSFTVEEVQRFCSLNWGSPIDAEQARALHEATGGWPAGLVLATEDPTRPFGKKMGTSDEVLFDYLAAEVLDRESPEVQQFLLQTSVLHELQPELCNHLLEVSDSSERLQDLAERNALFSSSGEGAYVLHSLYREFLVRKLSEEVPTLPRSLRMKAATWFCQAGSWGEALEYLVEAGSSEDVLGAMTDVVNQLTARGEWSKLAAALGRLPEGVIRERPHFLLALGRAVGELGNPDKQLELVNLARRSFLYIEDWVGVGRCMLAASAALRVKGREADALRHALDALEMFQAYAVEGSDPAEADLQVGTCHMHLGRFREAESHLRVALSRFNAAGNLARAATASDHLGNARFYLGDLKTAIVLYEEAAQRWEKLHNMPDLARSLNNLGMVYYARGDFPTALELFGRSLELAEKLGLGRAKGYAMVSMADVLRDSGQTRQAVDLYAQGLNLAKEVGDGDLLAYATGALARAYLAAGDSAKATTLIDQALAQATARENLLEMGIFLSARGAIDHREGKHESAQQSLEEAIRLFDHLGARLELAQAFFAMAQLHFSRSELEEARASLKLVAQVVAERGHWSFITSAGEAALPLLRFGCSHAELADALYPALESLENRSRRTMELLKGLDKIQSQEVAKEGPALTAYAMGSTEVSLDGREVSGSEWRSPGAKELFFYFITQSRPVTKEEVLAALWPELSPGHAESAFKSNLFRMRRALYTDLVVHEDGTYRLGPRGSLYYDAQHFRTLLDKARRLPRGHPLRATLMKEAIELYRGPFLPEFYSEWCAVERRHLELQYVKALATLAGFCAGEGNYEQAAELCERIVQVDPFNEEARFDLVHNLIQAGLKPAALRAYREYEAFLDTELGERPSATFLDLRATLQG